MIPPPWPVKSGDYPNTDHFVADGHSMAATVDSGK
jgi:hypothetical protein